MASSQFVVDDPAGAKAAQGCAQVALAEVPKVGLSRLGVLCCFRRPENGLKLREASRPAGLPE